MREGEAMRARSRMECPALQFITKVNGCGGKPFRFFKDVSNIAQICEGGPAQVLCGALPSRVAMPA